MSKTILIIDDSASVRDVAGIALKAAGYDVVEAVDGPEALMRLARQKIHLIVSDYDMPNMEGLAFVDAVRKLSAYKFIPIVMLTAESRKIKESKDGIDGVKAWIVKPFQPAQMLAAVTKLILP